MFFVSLAVGYVILCTSLIALYTNFHLFQGWQADDVCLCTRMQPSGKVNDQECQQELAFLCQYDCDNVHGTCRSYS